MFDMRIERNESEIFKVNQSVFFKMNQSDNCCEMSFFLRGQTRTNQKKAKGNLDPQISDLLSTCKNRLFTRAQAIGRGHAS